jgi:hypothetical protein
VAVDGVLDLVFVVFHTIFNPTSQDEPVRRFENAARQLAPLRELPRAPLRVESRKAPAPAGARPAGALRGARASVGRASGLAALSARAGRDLGAPYSPEV